MFANTVTQMRGLRLPHFTDEEAKAEKGVNTVQVLSDM